MTSNADKINSFCVSNGKYNYSVTEYSNRNEWLAGRSKTIGASEASAVIGINPWMTEVDLWERKTGRVKEVSNGNSDTRRGSMSENHIRDLYAIEMGVQVYDGTNIILHSIEFPWMSATLDGVVNAASPIVLEIKSVRNPRGEWGEDTIPQYYLCQVLHQLAVTGWSEAILLARFARNPGWESAREQSYHIIRSDYEDQIQKLVKKEKEFYDKYIVADKRPPVRMPTL